MFNNGASESEKQYKREMLGWDGGNAVMLLVSDVLQRARQNSDRQAPHASARSRESLLASGGNEMATGRQTQHSMP